MQLFLPSCLRPSSGCIKWDISHVVDRFRALAVIVWPGAVLTQKFWGRGGIAPSIPSSPSPFIRSPKPKRIRTPHTVKTLRFRCILISRFWNVEILLHFNLAFSQCSTSIHQTFDGQTEFLRVFNFAILYYSQNSRTFDAREKCYTLGVHFSG